MIKWHDSSFVYVHEELLCIRHLSFTILLSPLWWRKPQIMRFVD
jgi:hypothetical protein